MTGHILRHGTWVAVCDCRKALLFENNGNVDYPKLKMREHFEHKSASTHAQGASAPGRAFGTAGGRRGSVKQTDFCNQDEEALLRKFTERLRRQTRDHEVKSLILVAPARALGMIPPVLWPSTRQVLVAELDRDDVKMPSHEIEERFKG